MLLCKQVWCKGNFFLICAKRSTSPPNPPNQAKISKVACFFIGSFWRKKSFFWHFENNEKLYLKFSPIFLYTKNSVLKNKGKFLLKIYFIFLPKICPSPQKNLLHFSYQKIDMWKGLQIRAEYFLPILVYFPWWEFNTIVYQKKRCFFTVTWI